MEISISLPFFPGFDDEAHLSLYENPEPEVCVIEDKLSEIQEKCGVMELTYTDLIFKQKDYERSAKSAWIEEWGRNAPKNVVESVEAEAGYHFSPDAARAKVKLKDGWQEVMSVFMRDNETWLKENCDQEHYLEPQDFENWHKYLFEDYDKGAIADMIGFMMLRDYDDIDEISFGLIAGALNNIDIRSYVFLTEEGLVKLVENEGDEQDEEIRVLSNVKKWYEALTSDDSEMVYYSSLIDTDRQEEYLDSILDLVKDKFRHEWYKNYIGTKRITFAGPTSYTENDIISEKEISCFLNNDRMVEFADHRLKVGHVERQDRITEFMCNYPIDVLLWLNDSIPWLHKRLAQGGDYELFGFSKDIFLWECGGDESEMQFEYAAVLEDKYGIDYAVDYLVELDWVFFPFNYNLSSDDPTIDYIINMLKKAIDTDGNWKALTTLTYYYVLSGDHSMANELLSRSATLWKKGLITDEWLTNGFGLTGIINWEWGDDTWYEDDYPEYPDEDNYRLWLIRLLESDYAEDIADYLKPLLEMVMEKEKSHNWETGKKAIESFLAKTSNK